MENLFPIQEAKHALALVGADYLVFRGGRATVGPAGLAAAEVRALRGIAETAVYTSARCEGHRADGLEGRSRSPDAIVAARRAASSRPREPPAPEPGTIPEHSVTRS